MNPPDFDSTNPPTASFAPLLVVPMPTLSLSSYLTNRLGSCPPNCRALKALVATFAVSDATAVKAMVAESAALLFMLYGAEVTF